MPDFFEILHREWPVIKGAPYSFSISLLAVAGIIWAIFEFRYRKKTEDKSGIPNAPTSSSVSGSGNSSSTGNIVNVFPLTATETKKQESQSETGPEPLPELKFLGSRLVDVHFGIGGGFSAYECLPGMPPDARAIVACFRNMSNESITAYAVKAHLRFFDTNGSEIGTGVSGAFWLACTSDLLNIAPDESGCVLVLLQGRGSTIHTVGAARNVAQNARHNGKLSCVQGTAIPS
jgi:hypothetical protein